MRKNEQFDPMEISKKFVNINIFLDVRNCWNYALEMLESILHFKSVIMSFLHNFKNFQRRR